MRSDDALLLDMLLAARKILRFTSGVIPTLVTQLEQVVSNNAE